MLRVEGFEGPLDRLLEQAQARRISLARLPVLALVEQCCQFPEMLGLDGARRRR